MLGPGGLYPILQHPILGAAGRATHSQLTVHSAGRVVGSTGKPPGVRERAAGLLAEPPERPGCRLHRRSTVTGIRWPPAWPSACERVCHREQLASERNLQSAQGVACTVTVLRLRAWTSVPCTVLGPCVQYKSMSDFGLSGVQPTVNSQSTHSQLDSQLTVNSQSTRQSTQRTPGPPNPGILLGLVEKGVVICLDKEEGWEDRPLLIILIKLKRVFWWSWWPLSSSIRNRTPGFCGPVDR